MATNGNATAPINNIKLKKSAIIFPPDIQHQPITGNVTFDPEHTFCVALTKSLALAR